LGHRIIILLSNGGTFVHCLNPATVHDAQLMAEKVEREGFMYMLGPDVKAKMEPAGIESVGVYKVAFG
jgi:hypothetical protein